MTTEEFKQRVPSLQPPMQRMAERLLDSADEAEDLVQDLFVELWENRKKLDQIHNLEGFCVRLVQFRSVDSLRRRNPQAANLPDLPDPASDSLACQTEAEHRDKMFEVLANRMSSLPLDQRELLRRRYWEGQSHRDIGEAMNLSEGNVRVKLHRILTRLRGSPQQGGLESLYAEWKNMYD